MQTIPDKLRLIVELFNLFPGWLCKMLRVEKPFQRRRSGRKNCAQVPLGEAEPKGEDGPRDLTSQTALAQIRRPGN